ncbi:hypothetical protein Tco_1452503 [Tanacetum coccineum]
MANTHTLLLQELSRAADSHATNDQLSMLFRREVAKDSQKAHEFRSCDEILESIEIMRRMQLDDIEKASRFLLMARETQSKTHEKNTFIVKMRGLSVD